MVSERRGSSPNIHSRSHHHPIGITSDTLALRQHREPTASTRTATERGTAATAEGKLQIANTVMDTSCPPSRSRSKSLSEASRPSAVDLASPPPPPPPPLPAEADAAVAARLTSGTVQASVAMTGVEVSDGPSESSEVKSAAHELQARRAATNSITSDHFKEATPSAVQPRELRIDPLPTASSSGVSSDTPGLPRRNLSTPPPFASEVARA